MSATSRLSGRVLSVAVAAFTALSSGCLCCSSPPTTTTYPPPAVAAPVVTGKPVTSAGRFGEQRVEEATSPVVIPPRAGLPSVGSRPVDTPPAVLSTSIPEAAAKVPTWEATTSKLTASDVPVPHPASVAKKPTLPKPTPAPERRSVPTLEPAAATEVPTLPPPVVPTKNTTPIEPKPDPDGIHRAAWPSLPPAK